MNNEGTTKNYLFFLSYYHRDAKDNRWFETFYKDLTRDVGWRANLPATIPDTDIRFLDREGIQTGDRWDTTLAEALQSSRVFVPVYSTGYFKSEYCGKEFRVFHDRIRAYEKQNGKKEGDVPLIIPVLWGKPSEIEDSLPKTLKALSWIQFRDESLGNEYCEKGLEILLRLGTNEASKEYQAYQQFLLGIRTRIVGAAEAHKLERGTQITPLEQVPSAFVPEVSSTAYAALPPVPEISGPEAAWFVFVAGSPADFNNAKVPRSLSAYGKAGGPEWQPYGPTVAKRIGVIANSVASNKEIYSQPLPISKQLIDRLQEAEESNTSVVLLIDPWSVQLYKEPLNAYDKTRLANCGVIIVWNDNDEETKKTRQSLQEQLQQTFSRNLISRDVFFRESSSITELMEMLAAAIDDVNRRINERARLVRGPIPLNGGSLPELPVPSDNGGNASRAASIGGGAS